MRDITAVIVNWLTARRTLGAIESFREFYPDVPLIIVDDASDPRHESKFFRVYRMPGRNASVVYDPDCEKLKGLSGVRYIQGPDLGIHPRSHGHCVDLAIEEIDTTWMFHFHSDYRLTQPGFLELLMEDIDETYCGAGDRKVRHKRCQALCNVASLYNVKAGKEHSITFRPVIYYDDDTVDPIPGPIDRSKPGGKLVEAGAYFTGRLHHLGYKIKWIPRVHHLYGVHLRWLPDKGEWNGPY